MRPFKPGWMNRAVAALALGVLLTAGLSAQQQPASPAPDAAPKPGPAKAFIKDFGKDQAAIWKSPFRPSRHTLFTRMLPLAAGTATLIVFDPQISRALPNTPDQIRWSNYVSRMGAVYTLSAVAAVPIIVGTIEKKSAPVSIGRGAALALADSLVVGAAMKYTTLRQRPYTGAGNGNFFSGGDSFPSGHAMNSWAVCTALANNTHSPKWLKVTSYAVATAVSLSRVSAHQHFAGDVFAGSLIGAWIGYSSVRQPR